MASLEPRQFLGLLEGRAEACYRIERVLGFVRASLFHWHLPESQEAAWDGVRMIRRRGESEVVCPPRAEREPHASPR